MDEQTIKVLARLTNLGQPWPKGAWIYITSNVKMSSKYDYPWFRIIELGYFRQSDEISELEANQRGLFRDGDRDRYG